MLNTSKLLRLYHRLFEAYGPQYWWPADSPLEVVVGAVLTQNTTWSNVERAIANLKAAKLIHLPAMHDQKLEVIAKLIHTSGYYNVKAKRLKNVCAWLVDRGGLENLEKLPTSEIRHELLDVNGVGPETADDILLYALGRPVFVVDNYTRRLLSKLDWLDENLDYETLRAAFENNLVPKPAMYNEYHALIVRHAKQKCTMKPDCLHCQVEYQL